MQGQFQEAFAMENIRAKDGFRKLRTNDFKILQYIQLCATYYIFVSTMSKPIF